MVEVIREGVINLFAQAVPIDSCPNEGAKEWYKIPSCIVAIELRQCVIDIDRLW